MKASQLIVQLATSIAEHGDFDVISAKDAEGNGYSDVRGVDIVWQNTDDPELIYDHECEAIDDCGGNGFAVRVLIYV